uniref:Orf2 n=1 Tax=Moniliophthora roreri (strain MCA 2997) TaxID=1381753 RepID=F2WVN3_MONRO|nr:orf2 [Moniliophthora roreri]
MWYLSNSFLLSCLDSFVSGFDFFNYISNNLISFDSNLVIIVCGVVPLGLVTILFSKAWEGAKLGGKIVGTGIVAGATRHVLDRLNPLNNGNDNSGNKGGTNQGGNNTNSGGNNNGSKNDSGGSNSTDGSNSNKNK